MKRILISRTDSIGDVILTLPLCAAIKKQYPDSHLIFLAASYTVPVLQCCTAIDEILELSQLVHGSEKEKIKRLKDLNLDAFLHVFPKKELAKLAKKANVPIRVGTSHRVFHWFTCNQMIHFTRKNSSYHEAQLNFHLLQKFGFPLLPSWEEINADLSYFQADSSLRFLESESSKRKVVLHSKSQGSAVEWPLKNYNLLAQKLIEADCRVYFTGTEKEGKFIRPEIAWSENIIDTTGQFTLGELISFIQQSDYLVACSTGPLHIAGILNKNCSGLFSPKIPIHPGRWKPLGRQSHVLTSKDVCKCGKKDICNCVHEITVDQVFHQIKEVLKL